MESMDNVRGRFEALEQQMEQLKHQAQALKVHTCMVQRRRRWWRGIAWHVVAVAALGLALALPHLVQAKTFQCGAGDIQCLIDAINDANANGEKNTIRLEAGTYTLTAPDNDTDAPNGLPVIISTLTISGAGAETTIIERDASAPAFRILEVAATGTSTLKGLTLRGGVVVNNFGGGIASSGTLTLTNSTIAGNSVEEFGGNGGGIFSSGTLRITHSTIAGNRVHCGPSGGESIGGGIANSGTLTITYSTITDNAASRLVQSCPTPSAGGIANSGTLRITYSTIAHNSSGEGGGIFSSGTLRITHSTIAGNEAEFGGGGVFNASTLILTNSIITGNSGGPGANGGGILNAGTLTLLNSTLAGNSSPYGGGIFNVGPLTITNSTIAGNGGLREGGGIRTSSSRPVELQNTILARNGTRLGPDCFGLVTSLGNNLIGDPTGCTITLQSSDLTGDPGLSTFADNGRPGNGHFPLLPTSQAIDAGNDAACPRRDQIGQRRIGPCDIGAIRFLDKDDRPEEEDTAAESQ